MQLEIVRGAARAALTNLEAHRRRIDDLNVYPVPDGDTGTNLVLTLRSVVEALDASDAKGSEAVAKELSRAALMGARGNSGVITSQILRSRNRAKKPPLRAGSSAPAATVVSPPCTTCRRAPRTSANQAMTQSTPSNPIN